MSPILPLLILFLFLIVIAGSRHPTTQSTNRNLKNSSAAKSKTSQPKKRTVQPFEDDLDDNLDQDTDVSDKSLNLVCGKFEAFSPLLTTQEVPPKEQSRFQRVKSIDPQSRKVIGDFFSALGFQQPPSNKLVVANGCIPILFVYFDRAKSRGVRKIFIQQPLDYVYTGILEELQLEIVNNAAAADLEILFPVGLDGARQQRQTTGVPVLQICSFVSPAFWGDNSVQFDPKMDSIWTFSTLFSLGGCRFGFGFLSNAGEVQQQIASRHLGLTHSAHYIVQQLFQKPESFRELLSESRKLVAERWRQLQTLGISVQNSSGPFAVIGVGMPELEIFGIVAQGTQDTSWIPMTLCEKRWNEFRSRIEELM